MATHRVQPGDTLQSIAVAHYGHASAAPRVLEHNHGRIRGGRLRPGVVLHLPGSIRGAS